jgi:hypothetical protein
MTFRQNFFLEDKFTNKLGVGLGRRLVPGLGSGLELVFGIGLVFIVKPLLCYVLSLWGQRNNLFPPRWGVFTLNLLPLLDFWGSYIFRLTSWILPYHLNSRSVYRQTVLREFVQTRWTDWRANANTKLQFIHPFGKYSALAIDPRSSSDLRYRV